MKSFREKVQPKSALALRSAKQIAHAKRQGRYLKSLPWTEKQKQAARDNGAYARTHNGFCNACGESCHLVKDHDHKTGQHRGSLCTNCNIILGHAHDDPRKLENLIKYLQRQPIQGILPL